MSTAQTKTILLTGATGTVTGAAISYLLGSGARLRALVRDTARAAPLAAQGIELVEGDLERPRTLGGGFEGADTVWILTPPGPRSPEQSSNALWAARQAGVRHVVRMSAVGAAHDAPTINSRMHALSDAELMASGLAYTILRPSFFMQNLLGWAPAVAGEGSLYMALGKGRLAMIDARDIGEAAARVLTTPGHENRTYTLTGPAAVSMAEVAAALGRAIGKAVEYVPVSLEAADQALAGAGVDEWMRTLYIDYFDAYGHDWGAAVTDDFGRVVGHPPRGIDEFARDFAPAFGRR